MTAGSDISSTHRRFVTSSFFVPGDGRVPHIRIAAGSEIRVRTADVRQNEPTVRFVMTSDPESRWREAERSVFLRSTRA